MRSHLAGWILIKTMRSISDGPRVLDLKRVGARPIVWASSGDA